MDLRLLGPVRLLSDGRPIALGTRQQRLVLAVLALELNGLVEGVGAQNGPLPGPGYWVSSLMIVGYRSGPQA